MNSPKQEASVIEIHDPALDQSAIRAQIAEALASRTYLHNVAQVGPEILRPGKKCLSLSAARSETLNQLMIDLMASEPLHEHSFRSSIPLLGPFIAAFRRAWNSISTRWYVLPIMLQQAKLNQQMMLVLNELVQQHEVDTQRIAELETRLLEEKK